MFKKIFLVIALLELSILFADIKTFDINDYVINLENNKIEHIDESNIFMHTYKDSLRFSISTEFIEFESGIYPYGVNVDSMEIMLIDTNINIPKYDKVKNNTPKYNNTPVKLGARGTIRNKHVAILEIFPFLIRDDSLFFIPKVEYSYVDSFVFPTTKYSVIKPRVTWHK